MLPAIALLGCAPTPAGLSVLAASSLSDALPEVVSAWEAQGGGPVVLGFDSSSRLARQVEGGAPADVVFFADRETMDALDAQGLLAPGTRRDLLGNALVLVVPAGSTFRPASAAALDDPRLGHLAVAGENVPAGKYARAALAGVWTAVGPKVVAGDNVRTTLAWVARGEAEAGVVYATDARAEPAVEVALVLPPESHPPIVYPAAALARSAHSDEAAAFLAFCEGDEARAVFARHGFAPPP